MIKYIEILFYVASRFINAAFLGGTVDQSISARAFIETDPVWEKRRAMIDKVASWLPESLGGSDTHCEDAWVWEVENAIRTLERNKVFE